MVVRDVNFVEAYKECAKLGILQYADEFGGFLDKCSEYLGKVSTILEIGSRKGGSLALLGRLLKGTPGDLLISISVRNEGDLDLQKVSELVSPSKVVWIDMNSHDPDTKKKLSDLLGDRKIDILFDDSDHSYEGSKSNHSYISFCALKSIYGVHDIYWAQGGVGRAFGKFINDFYKLQK